jgi:competence protein ComEC
LTKRRDRRRPITVVRDQWFGFGSYKALITDDCICMKAPVFLSACFFAAGIVLAHDTPLTLSFALIACGICELVGLLSWYQKWQAAAALLALAGFAFAGASAARLFAYRFPANDLSHLTDRSIELGEPVRIQGVLVTTPLRTPSGFLMDLSARRIWISGKAYSASGKIRLRIMSGRKFAMAGAPLDLRYGDTITAWARLGRPQNYRNPGGFDYRRWLQSVQDIYWQGTVEDRASLRKLPGAKPPILKCLIEHLRQQLTTSIDRLYPPWTLRGRDGSVLKAVLLGDRSSLDSDTIEDFRRTGLYHLLVVAGLHVGLLAMLAEALLRLLRIRPTWRAALLLLLLVFYASLVEQRAPTLRASLMIGAYLLARLLDREQPVLNAVGLAALILLFERPGWLVDAGFQLSFAAALLIAGLALPILERTTEPYRRALGHLEERALDREFAPRLAQFRLDARDAGEWLSRRSSFFESRSALAAKLVAVPLRAGIWVIDLLVFSAVLQLGLLLPMAEIFHRITLAGIGLNLLAIPCMTVLLAVAVPTVVLSALLPALAVLPGKLLAVILNGLFALTDLPNLPHWLSYRVPTPPASVAWGFILCLVAVGCTLAARRRVFAIAMLGAATFAVLICIQPFAPRIPSGVLEITDLDCGGGEALFMVLPDRTTVLVGACGGSRRRTGGGDPLRARRWDPGENIVSPYLWSRGIKSIDLFLLPEARDDRLSGVASVLRNFHVKEFWCGALPPAPYSAALLDLLQRRGVRFLRLTPGQTMSQHDMSATVIWPSARESSDLGPSHGSLALVRLSSEKRSILLAGDVPPRDLKFVTDSNPGVHSEVLEAPDRVGFKGEIAAFAAKVHPRVVLLDSVRNYGKGSRDSSPPKTLEGGDLRLLSVATDGAITVELRSNAVSLHCYRGPCQ